MSHGPSASPGLPPSQTSARWRDLLVVLPSFAIAFGSAENLALLARKAVIGTWVLAGPEILWMTPTAVLMIMISATAGWWVVSSLMRLQSQTRLRLLLSIIAGLGFLGVGGLFANSVHPAALAFLALGLAVRVSSVARTRWHSLVRVCRVALGPALGVMIVLAIGLPVRRVLREQSAVRGLPHAREGAPNVLLIVWDTARAMSLSAFGYERATTPALERAAGLGARFIRAVAPSPWTLPSHATFMTGLPAHRTGTDWWKPLGSSATTLGEHFQSLGYRTGGFVGNHIFTTSESGLERGFNRYRDFPVTWAQLLRAASLVRAGSERMIIRRALNTWQVLGRKSATVVNHEFLQWLDEGGDRPFFAFLNYFDPHAPFEAPDVYWDRFVREHPSRSFVDRVWNHGHPLQAQREWGYVDDMELRKDTYDAAVAATDAQFDALLQALTERKILDNTIIIIVADHGEEFDTHGMMGHGDLLYWPSLWVPLVIIAPGQVPAGLTIDQSADLTDLAPTILDLAGVPDPLFEGRSLRRLWADADAPDDTVVSWLSPVPTRKDRTGMISWSLAAGRLHYVEHWNEPGELYDVETDPDELNNLASQPEYYEVRDHLAARLQALRGAWR